MRETTQESLGFNSADLVFGHAVRGPLRLLKDKWLSYVTRVEYNVLDYVSSFLERLHRACEIAQQTLSANQSKMKWRYDKKAVVRSFEAGDQVLVLLPIPGSGLQARFSGPYVVERKLSDIDFVIYTPDRKRSSRVCHINRKINAITKPDSFSLPRMEDCVDCVRTAKYVIKLDLLMYVQDIHFRHS